VKPQGIRTVVRPTSCTPDAKVVIGRFSGLDATLHARDRILAASPGHSARIEVL
jgi:hypothetical protein